MEKISNADLQTLIRSGEAIGSKGGYPAVVVHPDGIVTKFWTKRPRLCRFLPFKSYPHRFARAARLLKDEGFIAPEVLSIQTLENALVDILRYREIPGTSIRDLLTSDPEGFDATALVSFFHDLHDKGIIFKAIHFGNIIALDDSNFGLIDLSRVHRKKRSLTLEERAKNIAFPLRYQDDADRFTSLKEIDFLEAYLDQSDFDSSQKDHFRQAVNARLQKR